MDKIKAITLALSDYFQETKLNQAIIGLSGGIDSSLVAVLSVLALGSKNVSGVFMPSNFSSKQSQEDASKLAKNLAIEYQEISIHNILESYQNTSYFLESGKIKPLNKTAKKDQFELKKRFEKISQPKFKNPLTPQNLQARIRGNILMLLANEKNALVLATSNKTEVALGYTTLYGDSVGGISPIADLDKLEVYQMAKFLNQNYEKVIAELKNLNLVSNNLLKKEEEKSDNTSLKSNKKEIKADNKNSFQNVLNTTELIPNSVLTKPATAELTKDQTDEKSLGASYKILVPLTNFLIQNDVDLQNSKKIQELSQKFPLKPEKIVEIINRIKNSEFKRRQMPFGIKLTKKAFGGGRRVSI